MHWIDPAYLPETTGAVDRFLINSHGDADGLLLKDGKEVHFPSHMSEAVLATVKTGDAVKVRGLRPRGVDMVVAVSIQAGDRPSIVANGPPSMPPVRNHPRPPIGRVPATTPRSARTAGA